MAVADNLNQNYLQNIAGISKAFQPLDSKALEVALGAGGSLGGSLGFGDGGIDVLGLTPEHVNQLIQNRGAIQGQNQSLISNMAAISDMITGGKETRDALRTATRDIFQNENQRAFQQDEQLFKTGLQDAQLSAEWDRLKANHKFQTQLHIEDRASAEKMHRDNLSLGRARLDLERKRQMAITQAMEQDAKMQQDFFPASVQMYEKYETEKKNYLSAGTGWSGNPKPDYKGYAAAQMKQQALGQPYKSFYQTGDLAEHLGGHKELYLMPDGWHGVVYKGTERLGYTPDPVVRLNPAGVASAGRKSGSRETTLAPVYGD